MSTNDWLNKVIEANRPRLEESIRQGIHQLAEGDGVSLDELLYQWKCTDFETRLDAEHTYPFVEDEDAYGVYGYGHHDKQEFARLVNEYDIACGWSEEVSPYTAADVQHLHAAPSRTLPDERFTWRDVTPQTPGAFPLTLILR